MTKPDHQQFYNVDTPDKEDFELQQEQTKGEVAKKERRETPGNPNWYKGMGKAPGAGRKKGVPNKLKPETAAHTMLRVSKRFPYNPIEFLVRVYHNDPVLLQQLPENQEVIPIETRVTAAKTVAQYLYPAVKAADAGDGQSKDAVVFNVNVTTASGDKDTVKISAQKGDQTIDVNPETGEQE